MRESGTYRAKALRQQYRKNATATAANGFTMTASNQVI